MSLLLLFISVLVALATSLLVVYLFDKSLTGVLRRIIADDIYAAWQKYLKFAILVVGVSTGVRLRDIEKYATPVRGSREPGIADFGFERWVLEVYRSAIEALQGIAWMLLVFFVFALIAYVIVRIAELKFGDIREWPTKSPAMENTPQED